MSLQSDVIIVGGGASGLTAAISCARQVRNSQKTVITILEQKDRVGKKILATGNGKCNYTNLYQDDLVYRGDEPAFAKYILDQFGVEDTIGFFRDLGIYPKEKKGYLYPNSEQASSILDVLRLELSQLKVNLVCNVHVNSIEKRKNCFSLKTNGETYQAKRVILSTGGCASSDLGSDGSGLTIAKQLGHHISEPVPALSALKCHGDYFKTLAGVRTEALVILYVDNQIAAKEKGEVQLTNYGISGIPVFQLSRFAGKALRLHKKVSAVLDFMPDAEPEELHRMLYVRCKKCGYKTMEEQFIGLLNKKLSLVLLKEANISGKQLSSELTKNQMEKLTETIKGFKVNIYDTNSFENAQVMAGGVVTKEIDSKTLESKLMPGLFLTGELIDIDGTCGGYNLQWAWSTGMIAGKNAAM
jgi:flavoprotein, HI0933 family